MTQLFPDRPLVATLLAGLGVTSAFGQFAGTGTTTVSVNVSNEACVWLAPVLVGQFEFLEWTADGHLRHAKFIALREDKKAGDVGRQ